MVNLKSVTVTHKNGTTALKRVSLGIEDGEFVLVNGHYGAGKSTIVRLLTAEDVPTSGEVVVDGINTKNLTHRQIPKYRRRLGVVFQDFRLIPTMNVFDNIAFAMRAVGRRKNEIKTRVATVMEIVGLTGKEKSLPSQLSGGEQQRVALARAIVNSPKMIIADEPTGNIDPKMSAEVMDMLRLINQTGITVIVITHEQVFVDTLGARVVTLNHGRIKSDTAHPEVEEEYMARRMSRGVSDVSDEDSEDEYYEEDDVSNSRTDATDDEPEEDVRPRRRNGSAAAESDLASDISERVSPENRSDAEEIPADSEHSVADDPESLPDDTDKGKEADGE